MAHKSSRPGWAKKGYVNWAKLKDGLPEIAYEIPKLLKDMWNECAWFGREDYRKWADFCREHNPLIVDLEREWEEAKQKMGRAYDELIKDKIKYSQFDKDLLDDQEIKDLKKEQSKAWRKLKAVRSKTAKEFGYKAKKPRYEFLDEMRKKYQDKGIPCHDTAFLTGSFDNAINKFYSGKGGMPRRKNDTTLSFVLTDRNKGKPFSYYVKRHNKNTPFWIDPPEDDGRTTFYWKFGEDIVSFKSIIHRPIPEDGFIKSIKLARDDKTRRWSITFQVEYPLVHKPHGDKIIIFTPRWSTDVRIVNQKTGQRKGDLIIGQLHTFDKQLNKEVETTVSLFDGMDYNKDKTYKSFISMVDASEDFKSRAGKEVEAMKAEIKPLLPKLKELGWTGNLSSCQIGGIKRIREFINQKLCEPSPAGISLELEQYYRFMNHGVGIERNLRKFRDWCYWNIANRIAREAQVVYLKKVKNKELGKTKDLNKTSNEVESTIKKYKGYAAMYSLYDKIKKKCAEHGVEVVEQEMEVQSE